MTTARSAGEASPPGDTPGSTPAAHRVRRGTARPRMRRAATGGAVLASWAVLVAWLIASAPPLAPRLTPPTAARTVGARKSAHVTRPADTRG